MTDAVWRDVHHGRVWRAQACRVVEDTELDRALDAARDRRRCCRSTSDGARIRIPAKTGSSSQRSRATGRGLSRAARSGALDLSVIWRDGAFAHWYVNFEQPLRRTPVGFDTFDEKLDLIVRPDGTYVWKDEDELEQAAALGLVDAGRRPGGGGARPRGVAVPDGLGGLAAGSVWPIPQLPDGWERV